MKTDHFKAALLGVFVLTALALLIWFVLFLRPIVGDGGKELTLYSPTLDGIVIGTRVTYAGKPVGEISEIEVLRSPKQKENSPTVYVFILKASVDSSLKIFSNDRITLSTQGLLGEKSIAIFPQLPAEKEVTLTPLYIEAGDGFGGIFEQLENVGVKVDQTLSEITHFFKENSGPVHDTLLAVKEVALELKKSDIAGTLQHLDQASLSLRDASIALERLVEEVDRSQMLSKLSNSFTSLDSILGSIDRGEGTLGRLIRDDGYCRQIHNILCRLDLFLYDVNRFGILYHWNSVWKREQRWRLEAACCLKDSEPMRLALKEMGRKLYPATEPLAIRMDVEEKRLERESQIMLER
jgi:phospholipid/cholesterol/gamma-HCH transport system substrate-binding protein